MKQLSVSLLILVTLTGVINAQTKTTINQAALAQIVTEQGNQMANLFKAGEYKGYIKYLHPLLVQASGGEAKMIELLNNQNTQIKSKGIVINSIVFNPPSEIIKSKNELQCTISQHTELKPAKGRVITYTTFASANNGKEIAIN